VLGSAFELHVLDPMAEAGFARHFIAGADAIPDPGADNWSSVNLPDQKRQTVFERIGDKRIIHSIR